MEYDPDDTACCPACGASVDANSLEAEGDDGEGIRCPECDTVSTVREWYEG